MENPLPEANRENKGKEFSPRVANTQIDFPLELWTTLMAKLILFFKEIRSYKNTSLLLYKH